MIPILHTTRLILREFTFEDAPTVQQFANDIEVARNTRNLPHPYSLEVAQTWIARHQHQYEKDGHLHWAICIRNGPLIGSINLMLNQRDTNGMLGYWIGRPFWKRGYCTEAGEAVVKHAFAFLALHRVYSYHFLDNPSSGRVLEKLGFKKEGVLKEHILKENVFKDVVYYGLIKPK